MRLLVTNTKNNREGKKFRWGGRRERSGRRAFFRGKSGKARRPQHAFDPPMTVNFTPVAYQLLDQYRKDIVKKLVVNETNGEVDSLPPVSRNDFLEALVRVYGPKLTLAQLQRASDHHHREEVS